jgi:predicted acyl esterase
VPPAILNIRHVDGTFVLRREDGWPIPRTRWTKLYLDAGARSLGRDPAPAASAEYEALGDGVTFRVVLDEETEITGPSAAKLFVSSSTEDADLFLILRVFDPAGTEVTFQGASDPHTPIAHGWLRGSHRKLDLELTTPYRPYHTHDVREPLVPGLVYELDVEIWPTSIVVPAGYTLALTVKGCDYRYGTSSVTMDWFSMSGVGECKHDDPVDRPEDVFGSRVTLHAGGAHQAYVLLPVIPAG